MNNILNSTVKALKEHIALIGSLVVILVLLGTRMIWHGSFQFAFIVWNAFLACLPLVFSYCATHSRKPVVTGICSGLWLLFFPNAAYLLTDIVHLKMRDGVGFWLDLVILFGAGMWGVVAGLRSLMQMEHWYGRVLSFWPTKLVTGGILFMSGYGIYLGRVERWNSWDVLFDTGDLLRSIAYELRHPFRCIDAWGLSGIFAIGLGLSYLIINRRALR